MAPGPAVAAAGFGSQFGFAWESPTPAKVAAICRLLCSSHWVAPGGAQVVDDPDLYQLENPRAYAPSGRLQTTSEQHHPAPAQLTLHGGQRFVVSGHRQSLFFISILFLGSLFFLIYWDNFGQ